MTNGGVVITSANHPHYIALDADDTEANWRWTRTFVAAHRFDDRAAAVRFVARYLPDMKQDVWYLGGER